ncbi:MarR family winged helix-turn-helix transcriptional regulator [Agarivorans sp. 1_MG-2023]|uniref:MarR family winged helix-turn-helix transcriptional regulator n=1 Tax=Agarivorans sp. 1_MG-2023 TaxID=3062634 RepID=UPI0026E18DEE|nr:MarR family winged helix-turn-helix transcriptional regulator [Agarivorans sp. 1_MG-2023]MDO6765179.1 MarR family winged helix-turn-helix transcriptional regulator [Agarivorans sp. 1_MG-2023]
MSTRLTRKGVAMVDSRSLQLVMTGAKVQDLAGLYLCTALMGKGYRSITPNTLHFLSALECGINYGSEIARNLGVSRQMVAKTVKDLCLKGYLEQTDGVGKQKQIVFTTQGELLMADARLLLVELDNKLTTEIGSECLAKVLKGLSAIQAVLANTE